MLAIFATNSRPVCQLNAMRNRGDIAAISHRVVCVIALSKFYFINPISASQIFVYLPPSQMHTQF